MSNLTFGLWIVWAALMGGVVCSAAAGELSRRWTRRRAPRDRALGAW